MILRPQIDSELIERARQILSNSAVPLDTRAMITLLILSKDVKACPVQSEIAAMLAGRDGKISAHRVKRMMHDGERAGYFKRACGRLENVPGRAGRYWFIVTCGGGRS